jgi:hypothetical protein
MEEESRAELLRLGFTKAELNLFQLHGFNAAQVYKAVLELLVDNVPEEEVKHEFKQLFPELFSLEGL